MLELCNTLTAERQNGANITCMCALRDTCSLHTRCLHDALECSTAISWPCLSFSRLLGWHLTAPSQNWLLCRVSAAFCRHLLRRWAEPPALAVELPPGVS